MGIQVKQPQEFKREIAPAGSHIARCYRAIHIGTETFEWNGETKQSNKVRLIFEMPEEMRVFNTELGEQPMSISKEYTASLGEKATLRKDLESWRGKAFTQNELSNFELTDLVGTPCMLSIIHKEGKRGQYAVINSISKPPKSMKVPEQFNPSFIFDFQENFHNFDELADFYKDRIQQTPEYTKRINTSDEDLPF